MSRGILFSEANNGSKTVTSNTVYETSLENISNVQNILTVLQSIQKYLRTKNITFEK